MHAAFANPGAVDGVEMNVKRLIETISLFILIVVIVLRPLVAESYDSAPNPMTAALQTVSDPSPVRTLVFDLAILLAAIGWLVARALGPGYRYRKTGLEWGVGLIAMAAAFSCAFAGHKRLAMNATLDWLCFPLLAIVLVQLLRERWQRRVLIAAVIATGCVQALQCIDQYFVGFDDTWAQYQEIKNDFWARQGVDLDSSKVELFERRMQAREASGFLPHSNLTGSYLALCAFVAMGLLTTRLLRTRDTKDLVLLAARVLLVVGFGVAIYTTRSLGALVASIVGIAFCAVLYLFRDWIDAHRGRTLLVGWLIALAGVGSLVGYGLTYDRLPHMSLTFRWQYWKASASLIADHPVTGVGRENFGRHYLQYKTIDSPEEVANPHDLFVQAASDWGLPGLAGLLIAVVGVSRVLARKRGTEQKKGDPGDGGATRTVLAWGVLLLITLSLCRLPMLDAADREFFIFAYYTTVVTTLVWGAAFFIMALRGSGSSEDKSNEGLILGVWGPAAVLAFVVHDFINFALFTPACATTFFAVLSVVIAERLPSEATARSPSAVRRWRLPLLATVVLVMIVVFHVRPVASASHHFAEAKSVRNQVAVNRAITDQPAFVHFERAIAADNFDSAAMVAKAVWLYQLSQIPQFRDEAIARAIYNLEEARTRDPLYIRLPRLLSDLYLARADDTNSADAFHAAIGAAREVVELYPKDPLGIASLADKLALAGTALHDVTMLQESIKTFRKALNLDDARPEWERIRGFRPRKRQALHERMDEIARQLDEMGAATGRNEQP